MKGEEIPLVIYVLVATACSEVIVVGMILFVWLLTHW